MNEKLEIRQGEEGDIPAIAELLAPYIEKGIILPISERQIAAAIGSYFVITVDDVIAASACLIDRGQASEMAKFCTSGDFQGRGKARLLAATMIERARLDGKEYVFAVSVSEKMWNFFSSLGFADIDRKELPESWQAGYDFSRPSKAMIKKL